MERGFEAPINIYPTFENAIRAQRGESIPEHRTRISELWERFNQVAVDNPYAWVRRPMTAEQIRKAGPDNRMVGFPYTKAMNSNWDQSRGRADPLLGRCGRGRRRRPRRWVFPWAGTDAHDTMLFSERTPWSSPAIRTAGRVAFEPPGAWSRTSPTSTCTPASSAVQIAAPELGLSEDRQLTLTGGLPFAGGPLNNYVMHSLATMTAVAREHPGDLVLVSANGGFVTSTPSACTPRSSPAGPSVTPTCRTRSTASPRRQVDGDYGGPATIEAYTVMHGADGPEVALVTALTPAGRRVLATTRTRPR